MEFYFYFYSEKILFTKNHYTINICDSTHMNVITRDEINSSVSVI
jgi:hypothetical protein